MHWLFLGAGAIGTYIGGSLAAAGEKVAFIEQPAVAEHLAQHGLSVQRRDRHENTTTVVAKPSSIAVFTSAAEALAAGPYDVGVFALKSFDTESAVRGLVDTGVAVPPILSLQNGVDNESTLADYLGPDGVISGTVVSAVGKPGIGEAVEETHRGLGIAAGHRLSNDIVAALDRAGLSPQLFTNTGSMKWSKLLTNLQGNAIPAILDMSVAEVFADNQLHDLEVAAMRECVAVMKAYGYPPVDLPGTPVRALAFGAQYLPRVVSQPIFVKMLGGSRGDKRPSFHIDLHSGRGQSEVGWINGAVVRYGAAKNIPTPVNALLTEVLQALTDGTMSTDDFHRHPDALLERL